MTEMQQYLGVLKQLKDFDENSSREITYSYYFLTEKKIENDKCRERRMGNEE